MLALDPTDTIAAVASPAGGGVLGLVRVTGPAAFAVVRAAFRPDGGPASPPRDHAARWTGRVDLEGTRRSPAVAVHWWPAPRTYTGQPLVEVETVGSPPVLAAVLKVFLARGARLAEPGEFTLRAFLAGRIDLTQAEAVLGVIDAASPEQLDLALRQLAGGLAKPLTQLRDDLADTLAHLEANLDFADEAAVDLLGRSQLAATLRRRADEVAALAAQLNARARAGGRPRVVLVGPPNAGKSRLFNALLGRDAAIVTPEAGTTRDYLEAECRCDGMSLDLVDTAGIEPACDAIGSRAQAARLDQHRAADLVLDCRPVDLDQPTVTGTGGAPRIAVATKADLHPGDLNLPVGSIAVSALTGSGVVGLRAAIAQALARQPEVGSGPAVSGTAARSAAGLASAARALAAAAAALTAGGGDELIAVDLRQALDDLGRIVGVVVTDDLLDRIFRRFCIGK